MTVSGIRLFKLRQSLPTSIIVFRELGWTPLRLGYITGICGISDIYSLTGSSSLHLLGSLGDAPGVGLELLALLLPIHEKREGLVELTKLWEFLLLPEGSQ